MTGHVFVVGADLTRLSCDDVLVPTDRTLRVSPSWRSLLPEDLLTDESPEGACVGLSWRGDERVLEVPCDGPRRAWLLDTVDDGGRGLPWLLDGAREALAAVARRKVEEPVHGRARRLVGLPALGTGWGGAAGKRGELLQQLLPVLREAADEHGFDVALVLRKPSDLAAAQRVRRGEGGHWDLGGGEAGRALCELAEQLGERARRGQLAVFIGAGVSAAAGLPTWEQLVDELAGRSGFDGTFREGLSRLPPQDSAALLARELGRDEVEGFVQERFGPGPYALAHALIADLPVQEFVTTNYDPLVELAAADIGRDVKVLPFDEPAPGAPWLLKLHGDAGHPDSIVLTREEYLEFGDTRAALAGVLHSLLLTRHVLFVGTSMLDDDLIRIAHQVRTAVQQPGTRPQRQAGTVLALREDPVRAKLWERDVATVAISPAGTPSAEAAVRLEVLLDLISCLSTPPTGYLLDPAYRGLLDDEERALADSLDRMAEAVPADCRDTSAAQEVRALLRRLGHGESVSRSGRRVGTPPDAATDAVDDRPQEQRPG